MWVFLSSRLRTWVLLAVAVPVARAVIHRANAAVQSRGVDNVGASALARADTLLTRYDRRRRSRGGHDD